MELIALRNSKPLGGQEIFVELGYLVLIFKDCHYHWVSSRIKEYPLGHKDIYYELLETGKSLHHHSLFAIAPPIIEDETTENEKGKEELHITNTCPASNS